MIDLSPEDALDRLLEETALVADQDSYEGEKDAVTLITLHAAKGLEFDHVLVPDATHFLTERFAAAKLFYVAISRARHSLSIASSNPILLFPRPTL